MSPRLRYRALAKDAGIPEHLSNPPTDSPFGQWLAALSLFIGAPDDNVLTLAGFIIDRFRSDHHADAESSGTVHVALLAEAESLAHDVEGVSATRDGALAILGAAWLRDTAHGGLSSRLPRVEAHTLDDPGAKAVGR